MGDDEATLKRRLLEALAARRRGEPVRRRNAGGAASDHEPREGPPGFGARQSFAALERDEADAKRQRTAAFQDPAAPALSEILIEPDGSVLAHSLTPTFTRLLHGLNPRDPQFAPRSQAGRRPA